MDKMIKIKENWYMVEVDGRIAETNIQWVVRVGETYLFMVKKYLSKKEIEEIDINSYKFHQFTLDDLAKEGGQ
jgi:uncharacterized protein YtpQ (UPF0354 family)